MILRWWNLPNTGATLLVLNQRELTLQFWNQRPWWLYAQRSFLVIGLIKKPIRWTRKQKIGLKYPGKQTVADEILFHLKCNDSAWLPNTAWVIWTAGNTITFICFRSAFLVCTPNFYWVAAGLRSVAFHPQVPFIPLNDWRVEQFFYAIVFCIKTGLVPTVTKRHWQRQMLTTTICY